LLKLCARLRPISEPTKLITSPPDGQLEALRSRTMRAWCRAAPERADIR